jgi:ligand-binding SRPBCC domain-containing protein
VAAPRERVFAVLEDPRLADRLHPPFLRVEVVSAPWMPRAGASASLRLTYRGASFDLVTEIAEYRRGALFLERQRSGPFARWEHAVHLEDDAGGTRVTEVLAYEVALGLLGRLFDRLALKRDLEEVLASRSERLRALLEPP